MSSVWSFSSFLFVVEGITLRKCALGAPNFQKWFEAPSLYAQHTIKFLPVFETCVLPSLETNPRTHEPCCPNCYIFTTCGEILWNIHISLHTPTPGTEFPKPLSFLKWPGTTSISCLLRRPCVGSWPPPGWSQDNQNAQDSIRSWEHFCYLEMSRFTFLLREYLHRIYNSGGSRLFCWCFKI